MKNKSQILGLHLMLVASLLLAGCGSSETDSTTTPNVTQAYQTVESRLTEASARTPVATPTTPPTNTPPPQPSPTNTQAVTNTAAPTNTTGNDHHLRLAAAINRVTIPDNRLFGGLTGPGGAGSRPCTWTRSYTTPYFQVTGWVPLVAFHFPRCISRSIRGYLGRYDSPRHCRHLPGQLEAA
jgi:hypothetical protein